MKLRRIEIRIVPFRGKELVFAISPLTVGGDFFNTVVTPYAGMLKKFLLDKDKGDRRAARSLKKQWGKR